MIEVTEMVAVIGSCRREMQAMLPADEFASLSSKTRQEYRKLGRTLLNRARYAEGGVVEVLNATQRPPTFYKRLAALRYCLYADLRRVPGGLALRTHRSPGGQVASHDHSHPVAAAAGLVP